MSLLDKITSYYKCDEASGDLIDAHSTHDFTDVNTVGSGVGIISNARDFEGDTDEHFTLASHTDWDPTGDWTLTMWIKAESTPGLALLAGKNHDGTQWMLQFETGVPKFYLNSGGQSIAWGSALSTATWYFIAIWHNFTADEIGIRVDTGTPVTATITSAIPGGAGNVGIGGLYASSASFDGLIDEIGWWKGSVLSEAELDQLYNGGAGLSYDDFAGIQDAIVAWMTA